MDSYTTIPIVLCLDSNYADWAAITIYSVHRSTKTRLKFYCIVPEGQNSEFISIEKVKSQYSLDIEIIKFNIEIFKDWVSPSYYTTVVYSKLLIPNLIPESKVIYLDSDTLVLRDLAELFHYDLNNCAIGAVPDEYGDTFKNVPRNDDDIYINAGVMLMDLQKLRADNFFQKCFDIYHQYADKLQCVDQCVINKYAENSKSILPKKWNTQTLTNHIDKQDWENNKKTTSILHFVWKVKPWMKWCNPFIFNFYWEYVRHANLNLRPLEITSFEHLNSLSEILDQNKSYEDASKLKSRMIEFLLKELASK